jgi:hypothetical protein
MQSSPKPTSRKKFLWWGSALLAAAATVRWLPFTGGNKKVPAGPTSKMLTQDGRLVEIDSKLIAGASRKVTNEEMQKWIKKTPNQSDHGQH